MTEQQIRASLARLRQLKLDEHKKQNHIIRLRKEIKETEAEATQITKTFEENLVRHAKADCLQLCQMMSQKLPTELRDLVYQTLCIEGQNIPVGGHHFTIYNPTYYVELSEDGTNCAGNSCKSRVSPEDETTTFAQDSESDSLDTEPGMELPAFSILPDGRIKHDHSVEAPLDIPLPSSHFLNPEYVGESVAQEMTKYYYANNTFSICNVEAGLHHFLLRDAGYNFQKKKNRRKPPKVLVGIKPLDYVTSLDIRVKCEHFLPNNPYEYDRQYLSDIHTSLSPLWNDLTQRQKNNPTAKLNLTLTLMTDCSGDERQHLNFLEAIRYTTYSLKHASTTEVNVFHYDEKATPFPKNITKIFNLTKQLWDYELRSNENYIASPLHAYIAPPGFAAVNLDGGFHNGKDAEVRMMRWGLESAFDTKCSWDPIEGLYWPSGNECKSAPAMIEAYLDREVHRWDRKRRKHPFLGC